MILTSLTSYVVILGSFSLATKTYGSLILPKVCGKSTDALETVFQSTDSLLPGECVFELTLRPQTCGVRYDMRTGQYVQTEPQDGLCEIGFDTFSFNQPVKKDNTSAYVCVADLDLLRLSGLGLPNIELDVLCGELSGHHVNVPTKDYDELLPLTAVVRKLILTVVHVLVPGAPKPSWSITLTQLPCPGETEQDEKPKHTLAPIGCLQFYDEKEGIVESLNFLNGLGHYLGDLNYAICFKRHPDTCGIEFVALDFELASNDNSSNYTERDCDTLGLNVDVLGVNVLANKDYVIIPDGVSINTGLKVYASKFCGTSLIQLDVIVVTQGPLFLGVVTDGRNDLDNKEIGFRIKYKLLNNCKLLNL